MLTFVRVDSSFNKGYINIWYRDKYGQLRFFEFPANIGSEEFAKSLIRQFNEVLARATLQPSARPVNLPFHATSCPYCMVPSGSPHKETCYWRPLK